MSSGNGKGVIAKVTSYEENRKEVPLYRASAHSSEKSKGIMMIEYLKDLFGVGEKDLKNHQKEAVKEQRKIKWTRDAKGNIISPWSIRKKKNEDRV